MASQLLQELLPLRLEPFYYQVGGHFLLMKISDAYVCKPRGKRESHFYETIPKLLKDFVPHYYGVVSVLTEVNEEGKGVEMLNDSAPPPTITHKVCSIVAPSTTTTDVLDTIDKEREIFRPLHKSSEEKVWSTQEVSYVPSDSNNGEIFHNPWTDSRFHKLNTALKDNHIHQQEYILMEDVTRLFKCPSITDIKIGTRCHGDLPSPERIKRQSSRDRKNTTAFSMGVRFAGMLVYDNSKLCYKYTTRHIGLRLSENEFLEHFKYFLCDGQTYRLDVAHELLKKIRNLRDVIKQLDSYRFFSCSLLVVYEGLISKERSSPPPLVDVRLIDFEKATHNGYTRDPVRYEGPDDGALTGLNTLIHLLEESLGQNGSTSSTAH